MKYWIMLAAVPVHSVHGRMLQKLPSAYPTRWLFWLNQCESCPCSRCSCLNNLWWIQWCGIATTFCTSNSETIIFLAGFSTKPRTLVIQATLVWCGCTIVPRASVSPPIRDWNGYAVAPLALASLAIQVFGGRLAHLVCPWLKMSLRDASLNKGHVHARCERWRVAKSSRFYLRRIATVLKSLEKNFELWHLQWLDCCIMIMDGVFSLSDVL